MTHPSEPSDTDLRDPRLDRLGEGADLSADRRRALIQHIAPAPATGRPRSRVLHLSWAAAAAAAIVIAAVALWPAPREPISPTDILGAFIGPLPTLTDTAPAPETESKAVIDLSAALAFVWEDLEGPLAIASSAIDAPRTLLVENAPAASAARANRTKEN